MVDVDAADDALLAAERRNLAVAEKEQRGRERCRNTEAMVPQESAAISLGNVSRAEDILKLVPSRLRAGPGSAKNPRPISPQHVPGKYDDVGAGQVTAASSAASGSNLLNYEVEHSETSDVNTFPISCFLERDTRGSYTLSGSCCLCGQTFRAVGNVVKGNKNRWGNHARLQRNIAKHARMHGAIGYTPHRNLDKMRLDWTRSQDEASDVMPVTSMHRPLATIPLHDDDGASAPKNRKNTTFCVACAEWKWSIEFRRGASTCQTCLKIACAACGENKKQAQYRREDVYNFLNKKINALCRTCRQKGRKLGGSKHKTHRGEHCRECRCTKCGVCQGSSAFRRTKRGRVDVCRTCELVPCAACAAMLPRRNFTERDIYTYFAGTKHITCLVCREQQHARRQRLQRLMQKSKRAACTCKHPKAHTRKCPMHVSYAGDRPYPGCDVMTRADSDWFMEQRKKRYMRDK